MSAIPCGLILAQILGLKTKDVKKALSLTQKYEIVEVPKRQGGVRKLYIPPLFLKKVQRRILRRVLQKLKLFEGRHSGLFGVYPGTSRVDHALVHKDAQWVFMLDLKDAFPSIKTDLIQEILLKGFISELDSFEFWLDLYREEVQKLTEAEKQGDEWKIEGARDLVPHLLKEMMGSIFDSTDVEKLMHLELEKEVLAQGLTELVMRLTTYQGILPQGTPTAPFLFYLSVAKGGLWKKFNIVCPSVFPGSQDRYHFQLSMYIDNLVVSSWKPIPSEIQNRLIRTIEEYGFRVNPKKTRHLNIRYSSPLITGLRISPQDDENKVGLPKKEVRRIRGLIHRAIFEPSLRPKVAGLIASLKPIYGTEVVLREGVNGTTFRSEIRLPLQLKKPFEDLLLELE